MQSSINTKLLAIENEANYECLMSWHNALEACANISYAEYRKLLKRIPKTAINQVCEILTANGDNLLDCILATSHRGRAIKLLTLVNDETLRFLIENAKDKQAAIVMKGQIYDANLLKRVNQAFAELGIDKENAFAWTKIKRQFTQSTERQDSAFALVKRGDCWRGIAAMRQAIIDFRTLMAPLEVTDHEVHLKFMANLVMLLKNARDYYFNQGEFGNAVVCDQQALAEMQFIIPHFWVLDPEDLPVWWQQYWEKADAIITHLQESLCQSLYANAKASQANRDFAAAFLNYRKAITEFNDIKPPFQNRANLTLYETDLQQALTEYKEIKTCQLRPLFFNREAVISAEINSIRHRDGEETTPHFCTDSKDFLDQPAPQASRPTQPALVSVYKKRI